MSDEYRVVLTISKNGEDLPNMPIVKRYIYAQGTETNLALAPDNNSSSYHALAALTMSPLGVFFLQTDQAVNLELNVNAGVPLQAGGLILILGTNMAQATPANNVQVNNPALTGGVTANVSIVGAGT